MTSIASRGLTQQLYQSLFDHLDVDKSDDISMDELKAAGGDSLDYTSMFETLDGDSDGKIGRAEITGTSVAFSNDALSALVDTQTTSASQTMLTASKGALGLLDSARSDQETQDIADLFTRADVDGDGKLSESEWGAEKALRRASNLDSGTITGPIFMSVDADGDGLTSVEEVRAGRMGAKPLVPTFHDELPPEVRLSWEEANAPGNADSADRIWTTPPAYTDAEKQQIRDQAKADWAERTSGGEGTYKFLDREIAAYRSAAQADFSSLAMSDTLSSRMMTQILAGLESKTDDLAQQISA